MTIEYCLLWINWWPLCMTKTEWSGWVQAIGSIAALFGAVWIAERAISASRQAKESDEKATNVDAISALLVDVRLFRQRIDECVRAWEAKMSANDFDIGRMAEIADRLEATPIPSQIPERAKRWWRQTVEAVRRCSDHANELKGLTPEQIGILQQHLSQDMVEIAGREFEAVEAHFLRYRAAPGNSVRPPWMP